MFLPYNNSIDGISVSLVYALKLFHDLVSVQDTPEVGLPVHQRLFPGGERYMLSDGANPEEYGCQQCKTHSSGSRAN